MSDDNRDGAGRLAQLTLLATSALVILYSMPTPIEELWCGMRQELDSKKSDPDQPVSEQNAATAMSPDGQPAPKPRPLLFERVSEVFSDSEHSIHEYRAEEHELEQACIWRAPQENLSRDCRGYSGGRIHPGTEKPHYLQHELAVQSAQGRLTTASDAETRASADLSKQTTLVRELRRNQSRFSSAYYIATAKAARLQTAHVRARAESRVASELVKQAAAQVASDQDALRDAIATDPRVSVGDVRLEHEPTYVIVETNFGLAALNVSHSLAKRSQATGVNLRQPASRATLDAQHETRIRLKRMRDLAEKAEVWGDVQSQGLPFADQRIREEWNKRDRVVQVMEVALTREQLCNFAPIVLLALLCYTYLQLGASTRDETRLWFVYYPGVPAFVLTWLSFLLVPTACGFSLYGCAAYACKTQVAWLTSSPIASLSWGFSLCALILAIDASRRARSFAGAPDPLPPASRPFRFPSGRLLSLRRWRGRV